MGDAVPPSPRPTTLLGQTLVSVVGPVFVLIKVRITADASAREVGVCERVSASVERVVVAVRPRRELDPDVRLARCLRERQG